MSAFTNDAEKEMSRLILGTGPLVGPMPSGQVWLALHNSDPGETDVPASEVTGAGYTRMEVVSGFTLTQLVDTWGGILNTIVQYPAAQASWGTVTHFTVRRQVSGGQAWFYGAFSAGVAVASGDVFVIPSGSLAVLFD